MASLICKYCGSYITDTEEVCSECGAVNEHYKRHSDGTPRTIEQLQSWYRARKLPPEEVTRFFIGKDIREPRAFGIYEDNGRFIVYKNKGDGSRAIRYEGRDEAYAVNEIYLKLKEEILNQKKQNSRRRASTSGPTNKQLADAEYAYYERQADRNSASKKKSAIGAFITGVIGFSLLATFLPIILVFSVLNDSYDTVADYQYNYDFTRSYEDYYSGLDDNLYYLDEYNGDTKEFVWWVYDKDTEDWSLYQKYPSDNNENIVGPDTVDYTKSYNIIWDYLETFNGDYNDYLKLDISQSRTYIDAGHHQTPMNEYYYYNDDVYYFLDDPNSSYGNSDNTGWYIYENDEWSYYCSEDDKETLGEDLWYHSNDYWVADIHDDIYSFNDEYSYFWEVSDFEDTSWYAEYEYNNEAYQDYLESYDDDYDYDYDDYDWSSDSDWDWDSGDSWDSGSSDWDSDW